MKTLYSLALLVCLLFVFQQNQAQSKYGNATMDELNMQVYPKDTTAAAVVLLKKGDARFIVSQLYGFQFEYTLQVKIKILKTIIIHTPVSGCIIIKNNGGNNIFAISHNNIKSSLCVGFGCAF